MAAYVIAHIDVKDPLLPSFEQAQKWWASEDCAPAKTLRQATSTGDLVLIDGV